MSVSQQSGICVKHCGFHVSDSTTPEDVDTIGVMVAETNAQSSMTASLLADNMGSQPQEMEVARKTMYRISKTRLAPASMSPGLAMSQGDMTLADHSHLTPGVKKMMRSVVRGLKAYQEPEAATEGLGGTYFFKSENGANIAIMKPCDEEPLAPCNPKGFVGRELGEPGLKPTVRVGEAASREVAAYLLDHDRYAGVPHTVMVRMSHPIFHYNDISNVEDIEDGELPLKLGSLQSFVRHECDTTEMGTSLFNKKDVHRIGILDIRLFNTDRHGGNILVKSVKNDGQYLQKDQYQLIPIDHGFALPEGLEPPYFEWQHWPQAMLPFDKEELEYISKLDAKADVELLRKELPDIHESSFRILELATLLLQECAAAGLTLSEIAGVMTRPMIGIDEEPSELENLCLEIRREMFEELKAALQSSVPISHFSSMSISEAAEETADSSPDSGSSATFFALGDEMDSVPAGTDTLVSKGEDALFSMDEDGGAKTPSPSSPNMRKRDNTYNNAPYLTVKATGEVGTPFGTTFKSVLGGGHGVSPSYDSESPTHPECETEDGSRGNAAEVDFRGAQSYVPMLPRFATVNAKQKKFQRAISRTNMSTMTDHPLEEPKGCYDPSHALADMDEEEWTLFLCRAASKIAAGISSGVWQDTFGQVQQMSCPRF